MRAGKCISFKLQYLMVGNPVPYRDLLLIFCAFLLGATYSGFKSWKYPDEMQALCTSAKLIESELNWHTNSLKINESASLIRRGKFPNQVGFSTLKYMTVIWDYFVSSFDCPFTTERLGRVGDGGKWVCGIRELAKKSNCVVYSFGVKDDTSFEEEILERTQCRVHMFDPNPKVNVAKLPIMIRYSKRATFSKLGIGTKDIRGYGTLKTLMKRNGDTFMDILKVDIEGAEFRVFPEILASFPSELPFAQLQFEIHLDQFKSQFQYDGMRKIWSTLEAAGLRPFKDEPNLLVTKGIHLYHEFSFLNTKSIQSPFYIPPPQI